MKRSTSIDALSQAQIKVLDRLQKSMPKLKKSTVINCGNCRAIIDSSHDTCDNCGHRNHA